MEMVRMKLRIVQSLVSSCRVQQLILRSKQSIMELMAHTRCNFELMVHSSSRFGKEMAQIQQSIVQFLVHKCRVLWVGVHRSQSRHMELVHRSHMIRFQCCTQSNRSMGMVQIQ